MQAAHHSTASRLRRSWKHRVGLVALVLVTTVASATFGLLTLGARPATGASQPAAPNAVDAAARSAVNDQRIAEWTEIYVTQLEAQRPTLATAATSNVTSYDALREQWMAEWTEIYVTQLKAQGPMQRATSGWDYHFDTAKNRWIGTHYTIASTGSGIDEAVELENLP